MTDLRRDDDRYEIEEMEEETSDRWMMAEGVLNFIAAAVGVILTLLLIVLLVSLVDWLIGDMTGSRFAVLLERFR